jgi:hypothetical protein
VLKVLSFATAYKNRFQVTLLLKITQYALIFVFLLKYSAPAQENVGIGTSTPDSSAVLELSTQLLSSPKGFLTPRITTTQRNAITLPANGLLIFNTTTNQFEYNSGSAASPTWSPLLSNSSSGTVTSIGLSLPSIFEVSGSPVTGSGTLTATFVNQPQNTVFAGPASGVNAAPTFRVLDALDIPNLDAGKITSGTLSIARGGTNTTATPTAGAVVYGTGTAYAFSTVGTAGQVLSSNGSGAPTFRSLSASDISSGTLSVSQGGTGATTVSGILVGNGTNAFIGRSLTGTSNQISITNGDGIAGNPTLSISTNPVLPGNVSSSGTLTAGTGLTVTSGGATIIAGGLSVTAGTITTPLATGILHSSSGVISSSAVNLANADVTGVLPVANGGTNSSTALNNNRIMVSNSGAIREAAALTNGQLLIGSTGAAPVAGNITGTTNQLDVTNGAGTIGLKLSDNSVLPGTGSVTVPSGSTATRPGTPVNGMMRYNTTTGKFEFYQGNTWVNPVSAGISGSGTANYLPKYSESTTLGNSAIYDNGTSVAIGTSSPSASALFQMNSTTQGLLIPRMTAAQRDAIAAPATGLLVYVTDVGEAGIYNYDGTIWSLLQLFSSGGIGSTTVVRKTANESVTSNATFQDDDHLTISFGAGEVWQVEGYADVLCASATPDFKMTFGYTGTGNIKIGYHSNGSSITNFASGVWTGFDVSSPTLVMGADIPLEIFYAGIVETTTAGTLKFRWSQNQSNSNAVTVQKNSYLRATRLQ